VHCFIVNVADKRFHLDAGLSQVAASGLSINRNTELQEGCNLLLSIKKKIPDGTLKSDSNIFREETLKLPRPLKTGYNLFIVFQLVQ